MLELASSHDKAAMELGLSISTLILAIIIVFVVPFFKIIIAFFQTFAWAFIRRFLG